jgi:hypothetical protein
MIRHLLFYLVDRSSLSLIITILFPSMPMMQLLPIFQANSLFNKIVTKILFPFILLIA